MNAIDDVAHVVSILMLRTHFLMNMKLVRNARLIRVSMQPIVLLDECDVQFLEAKTNDVMDVSFFFLSISPLACKCSGCSSMSEREISFEGYGESINHSDNAIAVNDTDAKCVLHPYSINSINIQ